MDIFFGSHAKTAKHGGICRKFEGHALWFRSDYAKAVALHEKAVLKIKA